jgi:hypothetical protein
MIKGRNYMSQYLHDPAQRTRLLDYMASMYECIADFSACLIELEHGGLNHDEFRSTIHRACTLAMDIQGDWDMIAPMLDDIYGAIEPAT